MRNFCFKVLVDETILVVVLNLFLLNTVPLKFSDISGGFIVNFDSALVGTVYIYVLLVNFIEGSLRKKAL